MTPLSRKTSKLAPPLLPPRLIGRPRLEQRIDQATQSPLTLVIAAPGSGKTALLSAWAAHTDESVAWISLDARDDNPRRLWSLLGDALLAAGIVEDIRRFETLPHSREGAAGFHGVLLDLIPPNSQHVLGLDDAHHLSHPMVLAELDSIVRYGSPQLRLILSARSSPLLPLHRYRLAGLSHELSGADLAMTSSETVALMALNGVSLAAPDLAVLQQRTEGWAAGLTLSAMAIEMSMQTPVARSSPPARFVTGIGFDERSVGEYLTREVLDQQPDDIRRLLIQTSFLDTFSPELAAAVTGVTESSAAFAELCRTNSFVLAIDHGGDLYRYQHLFQETLAHWLTREYPNDLDKLRGRAADWHQEHGDPVSALRFAAEAQDWQRVCALLLNGGFAQAFIERRRVIDPGLEHFLDLDPRGVPSLAEGPYASEAGIAQAALAVMAGDLERADQHLGRARGSDLAPGAALVAELVNVAVKAQTANAQSLDRAADRLVNSSAAAGAAVVSGIPDVAALRAVLRVLQAALHFWEDTNFAEAERLAREALEDARRCGRVALELEALGVLQLIYITDGKAARAQECEEKSRHLTRTSPPLELMTFHHLAGACGALMRSDTAAADRALREAEVTQEVDADARLRAAVALVDSWVLMLAGSVADAYQRLQSAPEIKTELPARLARTISLTLADVETRLGRPGAALKTMTDDPSARKDPVRAMMAARAALDLADAEAAEQALRPVLVADDEVVSLPLLVYALLMSARVAQLRGDDAKAVAEILRACDLASDTILQPFVGAQEQLQGVLSRHAEARAAWPDTGKLPIPAEAGGESRRDLPHLALTERETTVLRRLATTMTLSEIADELCLSTNTVKTHVASIYRKLPAAGRRDAVARARQLELL